MMDDKKTELIATAVRRPLYEAARTKLLFGAHPGSVKIRRDVDLTQPAIDPEADAESAREIRRRLTCCSIRVISTIAILPTAC